MTRQKGIIKLESTVNGVTFVNSKRYRPHARAQRGTHKEARVNAVLEGNSANAKPVTFLGSPILKELKALETGFSGGDLWSRMMSRMLKAKTMKADDLLQSLKGVEINERYSLAKIFSILPGLSFEFKKSRLVAELAISSHAHFSKEVNAGHYLCEAVVLFFDDGGNCIADRMETEWISFKEATGVYEMAFEKPKGACYFLVVLGVKGGREKKEIERFDARGYRVSGGGRC